MTTMMMMMKIGALHSFRVKFCCLFETQHKFHPIKRRNPKKGHVSYTKTISCAAAPEHLENYSLQLVADMKLLDRGQVLSLHRKYP